ncbi:MAG: hypothetical protein J6S21_07355 [Victivallales bacterium]|nr:hypothetical protein [Victivallales bacterium]
MSVRKFKSDLLDSILELLWRQWTQLGVAGAVNSKDDWVLDPEALLIFSAHFARYDQRLYDLVIDWLQCNGESINLPRLKALLKRFDHADRKSLGFIAASVKSKKWQPLAKSLLPKDSGVETMFFGNEFVPKPDETALRYGLKRNQYVQSNKVMPFASTGNASLLLRLRGAFGMSARAEAILTMLNKEFCRIQDVADAGGFSWKSASDVQDELCTSGIAVTLDKNKRGRTYFLKDSNTMHKLFEIKTVKFPDWLTIFEMLSVVWECISNPRFAEVSERTAIGELQREFAEKVNDRLQNCGITSLSKLTAESMLTLPESVHSLS